MKGLEAVVYTRAECHLCEEVESLLRKHGLQVKRVDVDASAELKGRYGHCVPVVVIEGRQRFRGRVDPRLLRRLLTAHRLRKS